MATANKPKVVLLDIGMFACISLLAPSLDRRERDELANSAGPLLGRGHRLSHLIRQGCSCKLLQEGFPSLSQLSSTATPSFPYLGAVAVARLPLCHHTRSSHSRRDLALPQPDALPPRPPILACRSSLDDQAQAGRGKTGGCDCLLVSLSDTPAHWLACLPYGGYSRHG